MPYFAAGAKLHAIDLNLFSVRYDKSADGALTVATNSVTTVPFGTAVVADSRVTASGSGNTTFGLTQTGLWHVQLNVLWSTGTALAGSIMQLVILGSDSVQYGIQSCGQYTAQSSQQCFASIPVTNSAFTFTCTALQQSGASRTVVASNAASYLQIDYMGHQ